MTLASPETGLESFVSGNPRWAGVDSSRAPRAPVCCCAFPSDCRAFSLCDGSNMARYPLFQTCASFALLLAASVMASASPVDLPDVTVQAHVVEEGESDLHTTSGSRL